MIGRRGRIPGAGIAGPAAGVPHRALLSGLFRAAARSAPLPIRFRLPDTRRNRGAGSGRLLFRPRNPALAAPYHWIIGLVRLNNATMADIEERPAPASAAALRGLSGKLLLLTILFVMVGEVLIFFPSIANFRITWLKGRIAQAEIAALAVEAAPDRMLSGDLKSELLKGAGVLVVS